MKRILSGVALALVSAIGLVLVLAARLDDNYRVERWLTTTAAAPVIFSVLSDLQRFPEWSPWQKLDPNMKTTFSGTAGGLGSSFSWEGNNEVGAGRMTIVGLEEGREVAIKLEFLRPFPDTSMTFWRITDEGQERRITWSMEGKRSSLLPKVFHLVMDMDKLIGNDFQTGLNALKTLVEKLPSP